jgi:uncharacterized protein YycO
LKKPVFIFGILGLMALCGLYIKQKFYDQVCELPSIRTNVLEMSKQRILKNGDLIFQTSLSGQSKAVQLATNSKYSHCGLIFKEGNDYYVFEAIQPVKKTPLAEWIARGKNGEYAIKRLKNSNSVLTESVLEKMEQEGQRFAGKSYDLAFEWSDEKIYCSELIWKIYKRTTGVEIGKLEKLKDFDLTDEVVKTNMKERYGNKIPKDEIVISPKAIFESELLETVRE